MMTVSFMVILNLPSCLPIRPRFMLIYIQKISQFLTLKIGYEAYSYSFIAEAFVDVFVDLFISQTANRIKIDAVKNRDIVLSFLRIIVKTCCLLYPKCN